MRDGRRLFAGDEQRKGDWDFFNENSAISMEGTTLRWICVTLTSLAKPLHHLTHYVVVAITDSVDTSSYVGNNYTAYRDYASQLAGVTNGYPEV